MSIVAGPVWAALALLVVASAPKVTHPFDTLRALRLAGLRLPPAAVRLFGALEAFIGTVGLLTGHPAFLAVAALSYLGFTGFVGLALIRRTPLASCGCFGKADTPPTRLHAVLVALFALVLAAGTLADPATVGLLAQVDSDPVATLLTAAFAGLICWFAYLAMTALPTLTVAPPSPEASSAPDPSQLTGGTRA